MVTRLHYVRGIGPCCRTSSIREATVVVVGVAWLREGHSNSIANERWGKRSLEAASSRSRTGEAGLLFLLVLSSLGGRSSTSAHADSSRSNTARSLQTHGRAGEGSRVDGRHPDSGLVDLEEVGDKRIEVDVCVSEIVECQLLPIPTHQRQQYSLVRLQPGPLTFGTQRRGSPYSDHAL